MLRELRLSGTNVAGNWSFRKDYVHRDAGRLLASVAPSSVINHFTLDHLGTPRLVTDSSGGYVSDHHYYGYGQELNPSVSDPMKFTGHERDFNEGGVGNTTDELDMMHARYRSPVTGRFLSVDPVLGSMRQPQSWNRYSYAHGNPLRFTDPSGRYVTSCAQGDTACQGNATAFEDARQMALKSSDKAVSESAAAYGDPGQANGVTVSFSDPGKNLGGITTVDARGSADGSSISFTAEVVIKPGLSGTELVGAVAHEGSHLLDARAFVATISIGSGTWDLSLNLTQYQTELNAYRVTHSIFSAANEKFDTGCQGCTLGRGRKTGADRDQAIKRILADPSGSYGVKETNQGNRQFSAWSDPP